MRVGEVTVYNDYHLRVAWGDTDAAGIVFYPNFYIWMDRATHEFLDAIGINPAQLYEGGKVGLPLLETHCAFKSPVKFHELVRIRTSVAEVRAKVFKLTHDFYRGATLLASGYEVRAWVVFEGERLKASLIPDEIRAKLEGTGA